MALNTGIAAIERFAKIVESDDVMSFRMAEFIEAITTQTNQNIVLEAEGSPEGVQTAEPRKFYFDKNAGTGSNLYFKKTGSGNTGWVSVTSGDSPGITVANITLDDSELVVVPETNLQNFIDSVDHSLLKARGTGVTSTYVSSVTVGGTTFAQPAVFGEIHSDQGYFDIHYTGATGITVATLSATSTYVYIDKDGALQQQTTSPTRQDWSRKMFTMRIAVNVVTNQIINFEYLNNPIGHYANSIRDLYTYLQAQGVPFRIGQLVTGRTDNLGFNVGAGSLMEFGGTGDINNANVRDFDAVNNASYFLMTRTTGTGGNTNLSKNWDNNGVLTAIGSTTLVGHRLYRFSSGSLAMQYGQGNYANIVLAKAGVKLENYELNPVLKDATFLGWWLIESTATVTAGTVNAEFVEYTIGVQGGSSSSLSGALLAGNNLSDLLNASTARSNLGLGTAATTAATDYGVRFIVVGVNDAQSVNGTSDTAINFNTSDIKDSNFTHSTSTNPSRITVVADGRYKISGFISVNGTTSNYRYTARAAVKINGSTTRQYIDSGYIRAASGANETSINVMDIVDLSADDYIEIVVARISSTNGNAVTTADKTKIIVELIL